MELIGFTRIIPVFRRSIPPFFLGDTCKCIPNMPIERGWYRESRPIGVRTASPSKTRRSEAKAE